MPQPPVVAPSSAEALEFPSLLAVVAELAATDVGRERVLRLEPIAERLRLEIRRRRYEEMERLLVDGALVPSTAEPLAPVLEALGRRDREVEGRELLLLAHALATTERARERIRAASAECLAELIATLGDAEALRRRIVKTLDRRGMVRDDASPDLAALRRRIRGAREGLYGRLREMHSRYQEHLSEETIPLKDGRLVLLLRSGARGKVHGLVHGRSGTGRSLYFEPLEVVEANNELQESIADEEAERRRILADLVTAARRDLAVIEDHFALLGELDLLQACCRFGARSGGSLAELGDRHHLRLKAARHPLLDPQLADLRERALGRPGHQLPVVPLDLELSSESRVLVVTGPNAGGKTVALKTAGLLALAAQSGMPLPADSGSRVPVFTSVVAAVGDEQDLLSDQSTFSGRLLRLREAWEAAGPDTLLLLDEVGSGTDPEEGSALAVAFLEGLLEHGSLAVLTTHLTRLALAAVEHDGADCGAMEFDRSSGRPTYRLRAGAPGGSEALALAVRLGLPARWVERAEELVGSGYRELRRLLGELEETRSRLAAEEGRLAARVRAVERERDRLEGERAALEGERRELAGRLRKELATFRRKVNERLRTELEAMRAQLDRGRRRGLVAEASARLFSVAPAIEVEEETVVEGELAPGAPVRHLDFGWEGRLEKLEKGQAEVLVKGKRVRCPAGQLRPVTGEGATVAARPAVAIHRAGHEDRTTPRELNLVGWRVEPAVRELDLYLDRALLDSREEVRVIHGFGSGRLRKAVRKHLGDHPAVARFRTGDDDEGGDGATVVTLRED